MSADKDLEEVQLRNHNTRPGDSKNSKPAKKSSGCFGKSKKSKKEQKGNKRTETPVPKQRSSVTKNPTKTEKPPERKSQPPTETGHDMRDTETDTMSSSHRNHAMDDTKSTMSVLENTMKTSNRVVQNYSQVISSMRQSFQASDLKKAFPTVSRPVPVVRSDRPQPKFKKEEYNMSHTSRGRVLMLIHDRFQNPDVDIGAGPATDVGFLPSSLVRLGFSTDDIRIHRNLRVDQVDNTVEHFCREDFTNADCAIIFIISQARTDNHFNCLDDSYNILNLWKMLASCKTLLGKPKIVFIQSGQLAEEDSDHRSSHVGVKTAPLVQYMIPMRPDFLLAYSTQPGIYLPGSDEGTRFIQAMCEEMEDMNLDQDHLSDVLSRITYRITYRQSRQQTDIRRQCPVVSSTLMHKVFFRPKK